MKKILFVDDEPMVLSGLRRTLHKARGRWQAQFVESAAAALTLIKDESFDVLVTDMRMPEMDGASLLARVKEENPSIVRLILSGHSELEAAVRAAGLAHRFIAKPCDGDVLLALLDRTCELRDSLNSEDAMHLIGELGSLPSLPANYQALQNECAREEGDLQKIASIVGRDPAMTAKILQLVNSSFFGLARKIGSIEAAVTLLGLDTIKALALSSAAFSAVSSDDMHPSAHSVISSSLRTAMLAKRFAAALELTEGEVEETFQAGLLHDIGLLALAARRPIELQRAIDLAAEHNISSSEAETEVFKSNHCLLGAYLLGMWGLTASVVEAVAHHHSIEHAMRNPHGISTCVFFADALGDADRIAKEEHLQLHQVPFMQRFIEITEQMRCKDKAA